VNLKIALFLDEYTEKSIQFMRKYQKNFEENSLLTPLGHIVMYASIGLIPGAEVHPTLQYPAMLALLFITLLRFILVFLAPDTPFFHKLAFTSIVFSGLFWSTAYLLELLFHPALNYVTQYMLYLIIGIGGTGIFTLYKRKAMAFAFLFSIHGLGLLYTLLFLEELKSVIIIGFVISIVFNIFITLQQNRNWIQFLEQRQNNLELNRKLAADKQNLLNLTERLDKALLEARRYSELKDQFVATISHEIRTPMNGVLGMSTMLNETPLNEEQKEYNEIISHSARALLHIINDILDFSKLNSGKLVLESIPVSIRKMWNELVAMHSEKAHANNNTLRIDISDDFPEWVKGDPTRLRQIFNNLIGNANKFTQNGSITVRARRSAPNRAWFEIEDTGIGIPKDKLEHIFGTFTQVDASTTRQFGGTGLGLSITKQLVDLMNGHIRVESELGKGSVFYIELPLEPVQKEEITPSRSNIITSGPVRLHGSVLIVDDNPINRKVALKMLTPCGLDIEAVPSGEAAIEMVNRRSFDCILMDIQMPGINGIEATRMIRNLPNAANGTVIIALTANAFQKDIDNYLASGMDDYINKPIDRKILIDKIRHWLTRMDRVDQS